MINKELENIYKDYSKELYLYVFSLCKNHYIVEEIVNEAFYRALISVDICEVHIKYWLLRVSKNLWLDSVRRNKYVIYKSIEDMNICWIEKNGVKGYKLYIKGEKDKLS